MRVYHAELVRLLPPDMAEAYPFEAAWRDYQLGAAWLLFQAILVAPGSPFTCPDDPTNRSYQLFTILSRHVGWMAELDVASIFAEECSI